MKFFPRYFLVLLAMTISHNSYSAPQNIIEDITSTVTRKNRGDSSFLINLKINSEIKAYDALMNWKSEPGVPQSIFDKIRADHARSKRKQYVLQEMYVNQAIESYIFIKEYKSEPGVPQAKFDKIKQNITRSNKAYVIQKMMFEMEIDKFFE